MSHRMQHFLASETIATGAASVAAGAAPAGTTHAFLTCLTAACWVVKAGVGGTPTAVAGAANNILVPPGDPIMIELVAGQKLAAIQDTAGGKLNIVYVDAT